MPLPDAPATPPATPLAAGAFAALRHRNFRLLFFGQILSLIGTWMQSTAQGWLVLELTDSELLLGLVTAASAVPVLFFSLYAGVVADRADKRRIILVAQLVSMATALALGVLTHTGRITVWWILALVFVLGTASAFEIPTRQSFFVELVGKEGLTSAIALNSSIFNATRIVGPAMAGFLISSVSIAACFFFNAASYLAVIAGLLAMRLPRFRRVEDGASALEGLREGFRYIRGDRLVRTLILLVAGLSILGLPYLMLLPVFARDVLHIGAQGLGWLMSAAGVGALAGALITAMLGTRVRRGAYLLASSAAFALLLVAFAHSRSVPLSLGLIAAAAYMVVANNITINSLLQSVVPDHLRGRVMSVYVFMFMGMMPAGALQSGALAHWLGAPVALAAGAWTLLLTVLLVAWRVPQVRRVR